jgi:carboxypeptidase Taq
VLAKNIELVRHEAAYLGRGSRGADAYDYMIDQHDPGMNAAVTEKLFDELKAGLVPLVRRITASKVKARTDLLHEFPVKGQKAFTFSALRGDRGRWGRF